MVSQKFNNHPITRLEKGLQCEEIARAYLEKNQCGYVAKNFRSRFGEIDLIMVDLRSKPKTLIFVEVRYRKSQNYGGALESIDIYKQHRITQTAHIYLFKHFPKGDYPPCRFDVLLISGHLNQPSIQWIANAFDCM